MKKSILKKKIFYNFILKKSFLRSNIFFSNIGEYRDSKTKFSYANKFVIPNGINSLFYERNYIKKNSSKKKSFILVEFMKKRELKYY